MDALVKDRNYHIPDSLSTTIYSSSCKRIMIVDQIDDEIIMILGRNHSFKLFVGDVTHDVTRCVVHGFDHLNGLRKGQYIISCDVK